MTEEQHAQVIEALVEFVTRVSKGDTTCETEIVVLPQIVEALIRVIL